MNMGNIHWVESWFGLIGADIFLVSYISNLALLVKLNLKSKIVPESRKMRFEILEVILTIVVFKWITPGVWNFLFIKNIKW